MESFRKTRIHSGCQASDPLCDRVRAPIWREGGFFLIRTRTLISPKIQTRTRIVSIFLKIPGLPEGRSCRTPGALRPACGRKNIFLLRIFTFEFRFNLSRGKKISISTFPYPEHTDLVPLEVVLGRVKVGNRASDGNKKKLSFPALFHEKSSEKNYARLKFQVYYLDVDLSVHSGVVCVRRLGLGVKSSG